VDYLRACYKVNCRFWPDDLAAQSEITWYFVPDDAKDLDVSTLFCSRNWDVKTNLLPDLGELAGPRLWQPGAPPEGNVPGARCGTAKQWADGESIAVAPPAVWPGTHVPLCCPQPVPLFMDGEAYDASATAAVPVGCCPDRPVMPATLTATCIGADPGCECWLGFSTQLIPYISGGYVANPNPVNPCADSVGPWNFFFSCSTLPGPIPNLAVNISQGSAGFFTDVPTTGSCDPFDVTCSVTPRAGTTCGPNAPGRLTFRITEP